MINKVILVGRLGSDVKFHQNDRNDKASFSLATSETWTKDGQKQEKTTWHNIVVWGKMAEICNRFLAKGKQVYIEGSIDNRSWDDQQTGEKKYITEIKAREVKFLGGRDTGASTSGNYTPSEKYKDVRKAKAGKPAEDNFSDDSIPF